MKAAEIKVGAFYADGKMGLREVLEMGEHIRTHLTRAYHIGVRYRIHSSSKAPEIGNESIVALTSFSTWAKSKLTPSEAHAFILAVNGRKLAGRLTEPQRAFFAGIGDEEVSADASIECSRQESRLLKALHAKGLIAKMPEFCAAHDHGDIQLSELGVAVLKAVLEQQK